MQFLAGISGLALLPVYKKFAEDSDWRVRIEAAKAIAHVDRKGAAWLIFRELRNRRLAACSDAVQALNQLTSQHSDFDFRYPHVRHEALEGWRRIVNGL